ncbi:Uncharacterised protein [Erysipelothrix amsterdamensis]|uniref:Uncharacterized protein n=1 Tax=Erysipelothrix amsterdamensis TaxID=2929157 RepID=A0AAU9VHR4_9FIRM|nr:Uncharacterised protein [Erysipelothrix sp. A18Y020d]CAH2761294.1 Uncharacterised protein [Erysipelothrix sp. A18Y020d]
MNQKLFKLKNIIVLIAVINFMMLTMVRVILYSELHLVYRSHFKMFLYGGFFTCIILLMFYLVYYLVRPNAFDRRYGIENIFRRVLLTVFLLAGVLYLGSIMTRYVINLDRTEIQRDGMIEVTTNGRVERYRDCGPLFMEYITTSLD